MFQTSFVINEPHKSAINYQTIYDCIPTVTITPSDLIHQHLVKQALASQGVSNGVSHHHPVLCTCAIHQIFTGSLQSDVICHKCNNISATVEPFWDISLDLIPVSGGLVLNGLLTEWRRLQLRGQGGSLGPDTRNWVFGLSSF